MCAACPQNCLPRGCPSPLLRCQPQQEALHRPPRRWGVLEESIPASPCGRDLQLITASPSRCLKSFAVFKMSLPEADTCPGTCTESTSQNCWQGRDGGSAGSVPDTGSCTRGSVWGGGSQGQRGRSQLSHFIKGRQKTREKGGWKFVIGVQIKASGDKHPLRSFCHAVGTPGLLSVSTLPRWLQSMASCPLCSL